MSHKDHTKTLPPLARKALSPSAATTVLSRLAERSTAVLASVVVGSSNKTRIWYLLARCGC